MVNAQPPLIDLQFGEKEALYVAALEKRVSYMSLQEVKYHALLEMLTGETWETLKTNVDADELRKIAVTAGQRIFARSLKEAEERIDRNIAKANGVPYEPRR